MVIIKLGTNDTKPQNWKYAGVDFIPNSYPQISLPLDSRNYHTYRNKLHNSQIVFECEKRGRVAFFGGSITANPGWHDSIYAYLQTRFPNTQFNFVAAGIPSMGSTPGAFRFERDVLAKGKVDLLFEEAAVNDRANGFSTETQVLGMECPVAPALVLYTGLWFTTRKTPA